MYSLNDTAEAVGLPIQISPDQCSLGNSPKLFAACHVFHRLSMPRHPPYALSSLLFYTVKLPTEQNPVGKILSKALTDILLLKHQPLSLTLELICF